MNEPAQTLSIPVIPLTKGIVLMVTTIVAVDELHALSNVTRIVSTPVERALKTPEVVIDDIVELLTLQVPPETVSVKVVDVPEQILEIPEIEPEFGAPMTLTVYAA